MSGLSEARLDALAKVLHDRGGDTPLPMRPDTCGSCRDAYAQAAALAPLVWQWLTDEWDQGYNAAEARRAAEKHAEADGW